MVVEADGVCGTHNRELHANLEGEPEALTLHVRLARRWEECY